MATHVSLTFGTVLASLALAYYLPVVFLATCVNITLWNTVFPHQPANLSPSQVTEFRASKATTCITITDLLLCTCYLIVRTSAAGIISTTWRGVLFDWKVYLLLLAWLEFAYLYDVALRDADWWKGGDVTMMKMARIAFQTVFPGLALLQQHLWRMNLLEVGSVMMRKFFGTFPVILIAAGAFFMLWHTIFPSQAAANLPPRDVQRLRAAKAHVCAYIVETGARAIVVLLVLLGHITNRKLAWDLLLLIVPAFTCAKFVAYRAAAGPNWWQSWVNVLPTIWGLSGRLVTIIYPLLLLQRLVEDRG